MHEEETMNEEQHTQHTFGGRSLDRYVYEFETPEAGAGDLGALGGSEVGLGERDPAAGAPAAVADPAAGDPAGAAAAAELEPEPLSAEELQQMIREESGSAFQELLQQVEYEDAQRRAAQQQPSTAPNLPEWDPFNPEVVQQHIMASLAPVFTEINRMLAPAIEGVEQYTQDQGKAQAHELLDKHVTELGDFDKDRAIRDAAFMLREAEARGQQVDPEQVLLDAAKAVRAYEETIEQRGVAKFTGQAENLGNSSIQPGGAPAGEVVQLPRGPQAYKDQLARSLADRGLAKGVGAGTG